VVRYASEPGTGTAGSCYAPDGGHLWFAQRADAAYAEIGHVSVGGLFAALRESGYASYIRAV